MHMQNKSKKLQSKCSLDSSQLCMPITGYRLSTARWTVVCREPDLKHKHDVDADLQVSTAADHSCEAFPAGHARQAQQAGGAPALHLGPGPPPLL